MTTMLPARPRPAADEALDSYLERLATTNGVTTGRFAQQLTTKAHTPLRFTNIAPPRKLLEVLAIWTDTELDVLQNCLLTRYPIIPSIGGESRHGTRAVVAHGWVLLNRSQACPQCLAETGVWKTTWRLSWVTTCLTHNCLLVTDCPGCKRPLRTTHHNTLRPSGPGAICGNSRPQGQGKRCPFDLSRLPSHVASTSVLRQQRRVEQALGGSDVDMDGHAMPGTTYLKCIQALAYDVLVRSFTAQEWSPQPTPLGLSAPPDELLRARPAPRPVHLRATACVQVDQILTRNTPSASTAPCISRACAEQQ